MSVVTDDIDRVELIELRQQAHYWRSLHARAVQREAEWKAEVHQRQTTIRQLHAVIEQLRQQQAQQEAQIREKDQQIEALKAKVAWLAGQVFGRSSETSNDVTSTGNEPAQNTTDAGPGDASNDATSESPPADPRKRGQQPGATGHGRKRHEDLPCVEQVH